MKFALHYAVRSDRGLVRGNNEDSVYAGPRLLAIADGMGGHAGGEVASRIVIGAMEELDEDRPIDDLITSMREAVQDANDSLALAVDQDRNLDGMGTTLTAIRFADSRIGLVHVGDSRAYLLRNGELAQITHDDTYVQSLVDVGKLTLEQASNHPRKSVILRALNGTTVEPDVSIREVRIDDRYLLCTDGLSDVLRTDTLYEAMTQGDPQECADGLVALALRGGGPDNVTCIVADIVQASRGDDIPVVAGALVDPTDGSDADDDSPAGRAANLGARRPPKAVVAHRERRWPHLVAPLVIVGLLLVGGAATWVWTQTQYFVGRTVDNAGVQTVAIYRGVDTQIGPVRFYRVLTRSGLRVADLKPAARTQVEAGITADSRSDATSIIGRLQSGQLLPICPTQNPTQMPTPTPTATAPTATTVTGSAPSIRKTTARSTAAVRSSKAAAAKTAAAKAAAAKAAARAAAPKAAAAKAAAAKTAASKGAAAKAAAAKAAAAAASGTAAPRPTNPSPTTPSPTTPSPTTPSPTAAGPTGTDPTCRSIR